jgi:tetratricopeptide (TPR) repeat protein
MSTAGRLTAVIVLGAVALFGAPASGDSQQRPPSAKEQLDFGVEMAQRGLWNEALFRFQQAERLNPEDISVLNNLAVAYEALGLFDEALLQYQKALRIDPNNRELKRNYARFSEFFQSYQASREKASAAPAQAAPPEASTPPNADPPGRQR